MLDRGILRNIISAECFVEGRMKNDKQINFEELSVKISFNNRL